MVEFPVDPAIEQGGPAGTTVVTTATGAPAVVITRTTQGWAVLTPASTEHAADLVEAMSLADLVAEDLGASPEPGAAVRRDARGGDDDPATGDPRDEELARLQRTVSRLEHALATRVSTERAIGVLAARQGIAPREAFEQLRRDSRASRRSVHDLARHVLDTLLVAPAVPAPAASAPTPPAPAAPVLDAAPTDRSTRRPVEPRRARHPVAVEGEH